MSPANEHALTALVALVICGLAVYRLFQWVMEAPGTLDPWEKDAAEPLNQEQAVPLCVHCLTPQEHNGWFCPECGATVGPYCNYLPYVYIFSEGEVLRAGVMERLQRSSFVIVGFFLLSLATFSIAAPVYWFFLLKNLQRAPTPPEAPPIIG